MAAWVGLAALCLLEYAGGQPPFAVYAMPNLASPPAVYKWLAAQPPGVIVELPLTSDMAQPPTVPDANKGEAWTDYNVMRYQYFGLDHWQASVDGYSGFTPPHHRELGLALADFPSDARRVDSARPGCSLCHRARWLARCFPTRSIGATPGAAAR